MNISAIAPSEHGQFVFHIYVISLPCLAILYVLIKQMREVYLWSKISHNLIIFLCDLVSVGALCDMSSSQHISHLRYLMDKFQDNMLGYNNENKYSI